VWGIWAGKTKQAHLATLEKLADVLKTEPGALIGRVEAVVQSPPQRPVNNNGPQRVNAGGPPGE